MSSKIKNLIHKENNFLIVLRRVRGFYHHLLITLGVPVKEKYELSYWQNKKKKEGNLNYNHYKYFYTKHFNLDESFYKNKKILDIGCGPRGSLEWANMASERIGLDPLVESYRNLGIDSHKMIYICAGAENIPFKDGYFDIITSFNSLDHVDNLNKTIDEIIRVLAPGGTFLLLTDVNHNPTPCEPIEFSWDIIEKFTKKNMRLIKVKHYEKSKGGIYESVITNIPYNHNNKIRRYGILSAKFIKCLKHNANNKHNKQNPNPQK